MTQISAPGLSARAAASMASKVAASAQPRVTLMSPSVWSTTSTRRRPSAGTPVARKQPWLYFDRRRSRTSSMASGTASSMPSSSVRDDASRHSSSDSRVAS
ncbi:Uncharacterised protein [Bordetella pertussis]|nr:Uncharacterised protein [Bordetella pertussis]CFM03882.1 Uncharacterised protein [Bordetella pertussis]CFM13188.1 Uncharacterised protein [Bordetella pertussis]CFM24844.1 Uncharacterised protein [Bordetella pertussis]CFM39223.1 Uncharacterised protein [Bordetella pertussis]